MLFPFSTFILFSTLSSLFSLHPVTFFFFPSCICPPLFENFPVHSTSSSECFFLSSSISLFFYPIFYISCKISLLALHHRTCFLTLFSLPNINDISSHSCLLSPSIFLQPYNSGPPFPFLQPLFGGCLSSILTEFGCNSTKRLDFTLPA